jgi:LemA protein
MKNLKLWIILGVIVLFVFILYGSIKGTYNGMVSLNEDVSTSWSQVVTDYQRRMDLIPNLVNTVKGYADFEQKTLVDVIQARANATSVNLNVDKMDATTMQKIEETQGALTSSLSRLLVTVEKYPDLKANQNFRDLQAQLEGTENRIANARRKFNETTRAYNVYIKSFPKNIYANIFGFDQKPYFEASAGAEKVPEVNFNQPIKK